MRSCTRAPGDEHEPRQLRREQVADDDRRNAEFGERLGAGQLAQDVAHPVHGGDALRPAGNPLKIDARAVRLAFEIRIEAPERLVFRVRDGLEIEIVRPVGAIPAKPGVLVEQRVVQCMRTEYRRSCAALSRPAEPAGNGTPGGWRDF